MGRHSIPDPDEPGREPVEPEYGDYEDYGDYSDYDVDGERGEAPEPHRAESLRNEPPRPSFATEPSGPPKRE